MPPVDPLNAPDTGMILLGAGGHACVVADAAAQAGLAIAGFRDDAEHPRLSRLEFSDAGGLQHLGPLEDLEAQSLAGRGWIICLGELSDRRRLIDRLYKVEASARTVVHPSAVVSERAVIGAGVFIGPGAIVNAGARVLDHAIVNSGAIVEHDCLVGENAHIAPGAVLAGDVQVGDSALIGLGVRVMPGRAVGAGSVVGAGALVTRDAPAGTTVLGFPARERRPR